MKRLHPSPSQRRTTDVAAWPRRAAVINTTQQEDPEPNHPTILSLPAAAASGGWSGQSL